MKSNNIKSHDESSTPKPEHSKKEYHSPQLLVYGDICEITQSVGLTGMGDGGGQDMTKTGL